MEKRLYGKPLMSVENFTPSEYVATCWCIPEGACFTSLYHDGDGNGRANESERNNNLGHSNHSKIVINTKTAAMPTQSINDQRYYSRYETNWFFVTWYTFEGGDRITGNIYSVTKGGATHYFNRVEEAGNHS